MADGDECRHEAVEYDDGPRETGGAAGWRCLDCGAMVRASAPDEDGRSHQEVM